MRRESALLRCDWPALQLPARAVSVLLAREHPTQLGNSLVCHRRPASDPRRGHAPPLPRQRCAALVRFRAWCFAPLLVLASVLRSAQMRHRFARCETLAPLRPASPWRTAPRSRTHATDSTCISSRCPDRAACSLVPGQAPLVPSQRSLWLASPLRLFPIRFAGSGRLRSYVFASFPVYTPWFLLIPTLIHIHPPSIDRKRHRLCAPGRRRGVQPAGDGAREIVARSRGQRATIGQAAIEKEYNGRTSCRALQRNAVHFGCRIGCRAGGAEDSPRTGYVTRISAGQSFASDEADDFARPRRINSERIQARSIALRRRTERRHV